MTTRRAPEAVLVALAEAACKLDHRLSTTGHFGAEERRALNDAAVAYRAAVAPLRTRAEQNQRIAEHCRANARCWSSVALQVMRELCSEPTANETGVKPCTSK